MAAKQLFLALLFCIVQRSTGQRPNVLEISPQTLELSSGNSSTGGKVVITCKDSPTKPPATLYVSLGISRQLPDQESQISISVLLLNGQTPATGPVGIPGATVKGNATARTLELTIPDATCTDSGNYSCRMLSAGADLNPQASWSYDYFKVEVLPGTITLVPEPRGKSQWVVNETLLIRCNGAVGSVDNSTTIEWVWEYAYNRNGVTSSWSKYENSNDIKVDPMNKVNDCSMQQVSTLTRTMELSDTDRVYRCYITRNGVPYTQFAQTVEVGSVTREPVTTTPGNSGDPDSGGQQPSKADVGPIIGGVLGVLVVIIVVIVIVVVVLKKRRSKQAGESSAPAPAKGPGPYTVSDTAYNQPYSQPNRFRNPREPQGMTNKGMDDELGEKQHSPRSDTRPPRYANDFHQGYPSQGHPHQGHHNQGYNREPNGRGSRHHSSDEDGTDSRVNTSQMSIGYGDPSIGTAI